MSETKDESLNRIWTIGHSTHTLQEFIDMCYSFNINSRVDIRSYPGSRKFPHFNKETLEVSLPQHDIEYIHLRKLGGRRKVDPHSKNTLWRNESFRGYADYMQTDAFEEGVAQLIKIAKRKRVAYMCSEAVWWRCHRSMVSDYLKAQGWEVLHIMQSNKATEHPYTQPAHIIDGQLAYVPEKGAKV